MDVEGLVVSPRFQGHHQDQWMNERNKRDAKEGINAKKATMTRENQTGRLQFCLLGRYWYTCSR